MENPIAVLTLITTPLSIHPFCKMISVSTKEVSCCCLCVVPFLGLRETGKTKVHLDMGRSSTYGRSPFGFRFQVCSLPNLRALSLSQNLLKALPKAGESRGPECMSRSSFSCDLSQAVVRPWAKVPKTALSDPPKGYMEPGEKACYKEDGMDRFGIAEGVLLPGSKGESLGRV